MFIGNEKILDFFRQAIQVGAIGHAYCLVGAGGVGKRTLAKLIAAELLGVPVEKLSTQPDYYYLERAVDEKTGKLKKEISIAQARDLRTHLMGKSWSGGYRAIIIDEAELLNQESSNALLKTLEEPGVRSVFFLLTENDSIMLATIRSRCETFYLNLVPEEKIRTALAEIGASAEDAGTLAKIAWGRPGRAIEFLRDDETRQKYFQEAARWEKIIGRPFYEKLKNTEELFGDKNDHTDHIRERGNLQKVLDIWIMLWRDALLGNNVTVPAVNNFSKEKILEIINSLQDARQLLGQNIHPKILVEQILLKS